MIKTEEIAYESKEDAEAVLVAMKRLVTVYGIATLADLLELSTISSTFDDHKVGWTDLTSVEVKETENGFILDLPIPKGL